MQSANKRRTPIPWAVVREEYEKGDVSCVSLARKYGVSTTSVSYQARTKKWNREGSVSRIAPAFEITLPADGTQLTEVPIADDIEALAALRHRIIGQHKVDISRDAAYLNELEKAILEKKSQPIQKLNSLALIVKIRGQLIELERQAHAIAAGPEAKGQTNVQINVNVSPQDAYRQLIEGGGGA